VGLIKTLQWAHERRGHRWAQQWVVEKGFPYAQGMFVRSCTNTKFLEWFEQFLFDL